MKPGETELDHTHFSILAVAHKRHHNLGASWTQCNFFALKDALLGSGINFFWRCNYINYGDECLKFASYEDIIIVVAR